MFEFIRKHKETFAIVSGIITAAFFLWNFAAGDITSLFQPSQNCIVKVNGDCIDIMDFRRVAMRTNQQMTPILKQEILNSLIDDDLLYQEAKKEGFTVSDKEVAELISKDPSFQVDGKFSFERYKAVLAEAGYTPKTYESYLKKQLKIQKYTLFITNPSYVSDIELNAANMINNTSISGKAYIIDPNVVNINYKPTEQEIEDYYNKHKNEFKAISASSVIYWETTDKNKARQIYMALKSGSIPPGFKAFDEKTMSKQFGQVLKALNPQNPVLVGSIGGNIYIFTYQNNKNTTILPLDQVKNQVIQDIIMEKKIMALKDFAKNIYDNLKAKKPVNIKPVAFNNTTLAKLSSMVDIKSSDMVPMLTQKTPAFFGPYVSSNGAAYIILEIDSRSIPKAQNQDKTLDQLIGLKANVTMNYLIKYLRAHSKIDINKNLYNNL
jgi:peptidyl-prolyl cis-trans isomerase D